MEQFGESGESDYAKVKNEDMQKEFNSAPIKVIEGVNHPAGVVAYEYGGG